MKLDAEKRRLVPEEVPSDTLLQTALANHPTLSRLAEEEIRRARLVDAQQDVPPRFEDFSLIEVRSE